MRQNGVLSYEVLTEGGMDEFGEVAETQSSWSEPIPCSIKTNNDTRKGRYEDGEFRQASFLVLVEMHDFSFSRIRLTRYNEDLGEYRVISVEPLASVGRVQIMGIRVMAKTVVTTHKKYKGIIVSKTNMRKIKANLQKKMKEVADRIIFRLSAIGEECIRIARQSGSYNDITGNLRSSIGYIILYDGKPIVYGASEKYSGKKGDGSAGPPAAEELLKSLQAKFPWGIVLIVCAGMQYAAYVEEVHNKDVLTSAELVAEILMKQRFNDLLKD